MPRLAVLLFALLLAGCGAPSHEPPAPPPQDPAIVEALADAILTDPDLTGQSGADAAIQVAEPLSGAVPPLDRSAAAVAAAKVDAARLAGITITDPPAAAEADATKFRSALTASQMAAATGTVGRECADRLSYTARWAAQLPDAASIYPRGAVEEAAGSDAGGCDLRVVHYRTPVPLADVVSWHYARLKATGYAPQISADGEERVLRGARGKASLLVYVRRGAEGLTAVDIVAS